MTMGGGLRLLALVAAAAVGVVACASEGTGDASSAAEAACEDLLVQEPCFDCLETSCCEEVRACLDETDGCAACVAGDQDACATSQVALKVLACVLSSCDAACDEEAPGPRCDAPATAASEGSCVDLGENATCNPVTNEGCDGDAGESCDYDGGRFRCYAPPNEGRTCDACGGDDGFCAPGSTCFQRVSIGATGVVLRRSCARSCCDDDDCGEGVCTAFVEADGSRVGACLERGEEE